MGTNRIIVDIETVGREIDPDALTAFDENWKPPSNVTKPETIEKKRLEAIEKFENKYWRSFFGSKIVCAGVGLVDIDKWEVRDVEVYEGEEASIVKELSEYVGSYQPWTLVTYNGKSFDWPVVTYVASKHKIKIPSYKWHVDLMKEMQNGMGYLTSLKEACRLFGIKRESGVDGSQVADLFATGKVKEIADYQRDDVIITGKLALALSSGLPIFK